MMLSRDESSAEMNPRQPTRVSIRTMSDDAQQR